MASPSRKSRFLSPLALSSILALVPPPSAAQQPQTPDIPASRSPDPLQTLLHLTSSPDFRSASPAQQSSLLHKLRAVCTSPPFHRSDPAATILDQLTTICDSQHYAKLPDAEKQAALSLAQLQIPGFERLFHTPGSDPSGGVLSDELLRPCALQLPRLERLKEISTTRYGCSGRLAVREILQSVIHPNSMRQLGPTCFTTVLVHHLVRVSPDEFIRLSVDLVEHGSATTKHGLSLTFDSRWPESKSAPPLEFPTSAALSWSAFQALSRTPIPSFDGVIGMDVATVGVDAARLLGRDLVLMSNAPRARWTAQPGDVIFLTPDRNHAAHVWQVESIDGEYVTIYDPNGIRSAQSLLAERTSHLSKDHIGIDGQLVRIHRQILSEVTEGSFRISPDESSAPTFAITLRDGSRRTFTDPEALALFIEKERSRYLSGSGGGSVPITLVFLSVTAAAVWSFARWARTTSSSNTPGKTP